MTFAHDTEAALIGTAALVNTDSDDGDRLPDVAALETFLHTYGWTGRHERTVTELMAVRALRPRLRRIWHAGEDEIVEIVNGMLREGHALPQLIRHDAEPYHIHAVPRDAPLVTRMAVEAAMAVADVVRGGELSRLRVCEYPTCHDVLVDLSRNRSKRFCDGGCGNKAAVAAYRARRASTGG